ncbi:Athe_2463 domain-containing protein [Caldicellulosiruptor acetigenus]|uniref:Athe_2463 domain-containing protein n=1 Tax=Caldicellulosiruptor acetigenus TaxID=301953 RepID=UPI0012EB8495|nr:DUF11 domain-containing protein [Caldicellulosiruptor acetigenus]WAM36929.1 DUF11 domain-containing protein [Caldicellulosiruptor acetigenus]
MKRSLALFLSLVFLLEFVLQVVPVQKAFAIDYSAISNNYYEGGFDEYKGVTRYDIKRDMGFPYSFFNRETLTTYDLNVELAIDYRMAVYGLPTDVVAGPNNDKQSWVESNQGYWFIDSDGKIVTVSNPSNPPANVKRVIFKYMGFDANGIPVKDPYWPDDEDLQWSDLTKENIRAISDSQVKSKYGDLLQQNVLKQIKDSRTLQTIFNQIINGLYTLRNYSTSPTINGRYSFELVKKLGFLNSGNYTNYVVLVGTPQELYTQAYFFFLNPRTKQVKAVRFTGPIGKFLPIQFPDNPEASDVQTTAAVVKEVKGITKDGDVIDLPVVNGKYWVDAGKVEYIKVTFTVNGKFYDAHQILKSSNSLGWWYTRDDVTKWMTVANYLKLSYSQNGQTVTKDLTNEYLYFGGIYTGEDKYKSTQKVNLTDLNTAYWEDDWLDHDNGDIYLPTTELKLGTNTLSFSGKVRVFFNAGYHTDAVNSKSVSVQFLVTGLPKPTVQATVKPQETTIAKYNGQYYLSGEVMSSTILQEKVGATASVDTSQLFPGVKIKLWEFKVYKKRYDPTQKQYVPVEVKNFTIDATNPNVTPNVTLSADGGTCTFDPASDKAVFNEDVSKISVGSTYTPAYYVDARYQTDDGRWSDWASTYTSAKISVVEPLQITKTVDPKAIFIGDTATFTITVKNLIDKPIPNVRVYDALTFKTSKGQPTSMMVVTVTNRSPGYTPTDSVSGVWDIGTIEGNGTVTLTMEVKGRITGYATNTAKIMGTNQQASATLQVVSPERGMLSITKAVDKPEIFIGQTATFKITVKNTSVVDVKGPVVITDTLLPPNGAANTLTITSVRASRCNKMM